MGNRRYSQRLCAPIEEALHRDAERRLDRAIRRTIELRFNQLTRREREIMTHLVGGQLNKQVAWGCRIGEKTIKVHRYRVMQDGRALHCGSRAPRRTRRDSHRTHALHG